jgi:hypothetical protein
MSFTIVRHPMISTLLALCLLLAATPASTAAPGEEDEPLVYVGDDGVSESGYSNGWHDGRMRPAIGVQNYQVMRANRTHPEWSDGLGWTYSHAPNLAFWNGKLYYHYLTTPVGEHIPPGVTMLATSNDGKHWSRPRVLFPIATWAETNEVREEVVHNLVMHQRMGFYVATDGRLLTFGFYGINDGHGMGRVVREIYADDTTGPIYFIRPNDNWEKGFPYPLYTESPDDGFIAACEAFLADPVRRVQWWEENWLAKDAREFYGFDPLPDGNDVEPGKAFNFFTRPDGVIVGLFKDRWATLTRDGGQHWSKPSKAPTLTYGGAKIWVQRTDDGRYAAVYNPTGTPARHPLAVAVSDDGVHFDKLAAIHVELPIKRFWGLHKRPGQQYVRGIVEGNGNPPGDDLWVAYSVTKEDMWISRVPVPIRREVTGPVADNFDAMEPGGVVTDWNVYCPQWCPVQVVNGPGEGIRSLMLADQDPYDYAKAVRVFGRAGRQSVSFSLLIDESGAPLDIEVTSGRGDRHVQLRIDYDRALLALVAAGEPVAIGQLAPGIWHDFQIELDAPARSFALSVDGRKTIMNAPFAAQGGADADAPERIEFRTGDYRMEDDISKAQGLGDNEPGWDEPDADQPAAPGVYYLRDFSTTQVSPP